MASKIPFTFRIYSGAEVERAEQLTIDVPGVIKIGKLESSHLRIDDEGVSRMHALIEVSSPDEIHVLDLGSAKGTILNGESVKKAKLQDGSELLLGDTRVSVGIGQLTASEEAEAAVEAAPAASAPAPSPAPQAWAPPQMGARPAVGAARSPYGVPVPGAPMASVPTVPQVAPDATILRQDGSRAIEVTALFEDDVVMVRYLDNPAAGRVSPLTYGLLGTGWGTVLAGLVVALVGQAGFGGVLLLIGLALGVYGAIRWIEERKSPHFALGESPESDLQVASPAIPAPYFPLVRSDGRQYWLVFTPSMQGDVTLGTERMVLADLINAGRAATDPSFAQTHAYSIPQDARIKVDIGDHSFLVNSVAPSRPIMSPWLSRVDWSAQMSNGLSFAAHALLLFLVFAVPPDAKSLSLDLFDADNRFLNYLVKPPEQKEEDIPAWLKKKGPDKAGGKGQRHKGDEGKMGSKKSKKKTGLYGLKGPKDNPDPHLAKTLAENAVQNAGVLGILGAPSGSHIASIFGRDTALGTDAEDALGGLIGDQIGEAYGYGGLGLVGTGRGGGGTGEGTIGLGSLGTIGKGGGGGDGAGYGRGAGRLGSRKARVPRVLAGRAEVRGALDKEIIRRIIRRHINEIKYCYSKELQSDESLSGRVIVGFTIAGTGQVVVSKVESSTVGNRVVEQCIVRAVRRWLFPKPKGGGIVHVTYPFVLTAAGG